MKVTIHLTPKDIENLEWAVTSRNPDVQVLLGIAGKVLFSARNDTIKHLEIPTHETKNVQTQQ